MKTRQRAYSLAAAICILAAGSRSEAALITFESAPAGDFLSYTEAGVTFTGVGGGDLSKASTPNGTDGLLSGVDPLEEFRADIAGGASSVSVDLGDYNADPDTLFLEIFDSANQSLGFISELIAADFVGMKTLTLSSSSSIAYAIFGARDPALSGNSAYADNFAFTPSRAVPEPSSIAMLGTAALVGLGGTLRRRMRRQAS